MQFLGFHGMLYENKKRVGEMMKKISLWGIFLLFLFLFCGCTSEKASELWVVTEKGTWDRMNGQLYVLEEAWGSSYFWTIEQCARQTIWAETHMPNEMWDVYHYVLPASDVISPEEAKQIATEAVYTAGIIDPNADIELVVEYGVPRTALAERPYHYVVRFIETRIVDGKERRIHVFSCCITNEGEVMDSSYDPSLVYCEVTPFDFPQLPYESFSAWSLEEKADFSETYYEDMKEYMAVYPNLYRSTCS